MLRISLEEKRKIWREQKRRCFVPAPPRELQCAICETRFTTKQRGRIRNCSIACRKEANRRRYAHFVARNRERLRVLGRLRYAANPEKYRAQKRKDSATPRAREARRQRQNRQRRRDPERFRAKSRRLYWAHREKNIEYDRRRYKANPTPKREAAKRWFRGNRQKAYANARKHRLLAAAALKVVRELGLIEEKTPMTHVDAVRQGARRQSWSELNPRPILDKLILDNPGADRNEIRRLFRAKVEDRHEVLMGLVDYWLDNNYREPGENRSRLEETRKEVDYLRTKMLLNLPLPNGKRLRDATGKECARLGGWFAKIAAKVPARERVGAVLSEAQVQALFKGTKERRR